LFLFNGGHHVAAWRHPDAPAGLGTNIQHCVELARLAERGKFDLVFLADSLGIQERGSAHVLAKSDHVVRLEPLTLLSALSMATQHIGLVGSASTTYTEPYHVARQFASLDHISGGRAGWNLVTSYANVEARNFGRDHIPAHADRYDRALEFVDVVRKLWDTWEDDAFVIDKSSGQFFRSEAMHKAEHAGRHFNVEGGLNIARSPQGHPVIFQAGSSGTGRDVAAATADAVFTVQESLEAAQAFYADQKARVANAGRNPDALVVMPGLYPVIAETRALAQEKLERLNQLIDPQVGLELLSTLIGHNLSGYDVDGPLPDIPLSNGQQTRYALLSGMSRRDGLTIRQLYERNAVARGHFTVVGTAEDVAEQMHEWLRKEAADGFNVLPPVFPTDLALFVDQVVPKLQQRGIFRREYQGTTLRENLGLSRPANRHAAATASASAATTAGGEPWVPAPSSAAFQPAEALA
jgi:FMN-dependent oxidoreductase (nitrilotriacetate monooxygenase family)